jgi:peptidoglycan/xylan/chitin deacetylase (PgdA/CDA1 family)
MPSIAITIDDAPSVHEAGVPFDAERMDRCREILLRCGVSQCVAFVVGARARGHERALERWLAAGFELGNHTYEHAPASRQSRQRFAESLARCDELLQRVGAFDGDRLKWFRFPYLDRGRGPAQRRQLELECGKLAYRVAPATIDFLDHPFETPLADAISRDDERGVRRVERRFLRTCLDTIELASAAFAEQMPALAHVGYAHFGPMAERNLPAVLDLLRSRGFAACSLSSALDHPVYRGFAADLACNGLVLPTASRDPRGRLKRGLAGARRRLLGWRAHRSQRPS